jgi:hypothetical protein
VGIWKREKDRQRDRQRDRLLDRKHIIRLSVISIFYHQLPLQIKQTKKVEKYSKKKFEKSKVKSKAITITIISHSIEWEKIKIETSWTAFVSNLSQQRKQRIFFQHVQKCQFVLNFLSIIYYLTHPQVRKQILNCAK